MLYIVPNMNLDGAVRGNLRTSAAGRNLNREWREPDLTASPEVFLVREEMQRTGCDLFLDIHGDEALPYVFFSTAEEVPGFTAESARRQTRFIEALPPWRRTSRSRRATSRAASARNCSRWRASGSPTTSACVSLTLEMPFKDNANLPDELTGWNGARSKRLGGCHARSDPRPPGRHPGLSATKVPAAGQLA